MDVTPRLLNVFIPRSDSRSVYIFAMVCYSIAIDVTAGRVAEVLGLWTARSTPQALSNARHMVAGPWWKHAVMDLLLSPIVESLMIVAIIELLRRLKFSVTTGIVVATLIFSALHSITIPIWGLICVAGFFIQSASYVYWRGTSFWAGLQAIVLIHAFSNLPPLLYMLGRSR